MEPKKIEVCVVGLGSRGLSVLERVIGHARQYESVSHEVIVHTVDPGTPGVGVHDRNQPSYLQLNTISMQLTMFPDETVLVDQPFHRDLSFYEWALAEGYKVGNDGYTVSKEAGRPVRQDEFLPRWLLGEYLNWAYHRLIGQLPQHVTHVHHVAEVTDILSDGMDRERVVLSNGESFSVDGVFLTTGHTANHAVLPTWLQMDEEPTAVGADASNYSKKR